MLTAAFIYPRQTKLVLSSKSAVTNCVSAAGIGASWAKTSTHLFQQSTSRWQPSKEFPPPLRNTGSSHPSRICQPMHTGNNPWKWQRPYGTWLYLSLLQPCYLWPFPPEKQGVTSACAAQHFSTPRCWKQLQSTVILQHCLLFRGQTDVLCLRIFTHTKTSALKTSCVLDIAW